MSGAAATDDPLSMWDPRRRAALRLLWERFASAGATGSNLSDELIAERRREAAAEDSGPASE
jgi:hypothetical protein